MNILQDQSVKIDHGVTTIYDIKPLWGHFFMLKKSIMKWIPFGLLYLQFYTEVFFSPEVEECDDTFRLHEAFVSKKVARLGRRPRQVISEYEHTEKYL